MNMNIKSGWKKKAREIIAHRRNPGTTMCRSDSFLKHLKQPCIEQRATAADKDNKNTSKILTNKNTSSK